MKFSHTELAENSNQENLPSGLKKHLDAVFRLDADISFLEQEGIEGNEDAFDFFEAQIPKDLLLFNINKCKKEGKSLYKALLEVSSVIEKRKSTWEIDGDEKYKDEALEAIHELSGARFQSELFLGRGNAGHVFIAPGAEGYCLKYLHSPAFQAASIEGEFALLGDVNKVSEQFKALKVPQVHCLAKNIEGSKNFFTMEKIHGLTLEQVVDFPSKRQEAYPGFSVPEIILILKDKALRELLIEDIKSIHTSGVIHGDIHPRNIMLSEKGEVVLIDFGNAIVPSSVSVQAEYETIENVKELDVKAFINSLDKTIKLLEEQVLTD